MRRVLVVACILSIIVLSAAIGLLAADLPFWRRAAAWSAAAGGPPPRLPGTTATIPGTATSRPLPVAAPPAHVDVAALDALAARGAAALLLSHDGSLVYARYAGDAARTQLHDGGELVQVLLPLLYFRLREQGYPGLLDRPLRELVDEWRDDARGDATPRQLFWQLGGLDAPALRPFDPFSAPARLASGPNFHRAALRFRASFPPGTRQLASPANAQLLALAAERVTGRPFAALLADQVWQPIGAGDAVGVLDHRRGNLAAHCCLAARAEDWLRVALAYAGAGGDAVPALPRRTLEEMERTSPVAPGRALGLDLLRAGDGAPLLVARSRGRLLLADPRRHQALLWIGDGAPVDEAALLRAAGW